MCRYVLFLFFCILTKSIVAQILNAGFENTPINWDINNSKTQTFSIDSISKFSRKSSLKIAGLQTSASDYLPFYQTISLENNQLKTIKLNVFIRTENLTGTAALLCQILDKNGNRIGFQNSEMQNLLIKGNTDWKKYSLAITINEDVKKLVIGGYVSGNGSAWFDDFSIEGLSATTIKTNEDVEKFAEEIKGIVKQNSIYTDSLNWNKIDAEIKEICKGINSVNEAQVIGDYLVMELRNVGDNHSFIQSKITTQNYGRINSTSEKPESKIINNKIGYVKVPGFTSTNKVLSLQFADTIQNLIQNIDKQKPIKKWIVDLRNNKGGNMYPMIAGLGPLISNGILGYFVNQKEKKENFEAWFYSNGKAGTAENRILVDVKNPYLLKYKNPKIAILINSKTSSSGEMTAISFIGKSNVKIFGRQSSGYTTGNVTYQLSNGTSLVLAATYITDRTKKKYLKGITPDVKVDSVNEEDTLKSAISWLME
jgi:hypothetical protein